VKLRITTETVTLILVLALFIGCAVNPFTGQRQLALVNSGTVNQLAADEYKKIKTKSKVLNPATNSSAAMVTRVGSRLSAAIEKYYTEKGLAKHLKAFEWEYMTIDEPTINAWCMPGGKIAVYTGILPITQNEDALAVVMGHEVAHAIAEHGKSRMNAGLVQQFGGMALQVAVMNKPAQTQNLFLSAYNVGTTVGAILPWGRQDELEADRLGLIYCALAGYNPQEAIPFWQRMAQIGGGQKPPEWLSTHPAEENRIAQLQKLMPEAMALYKGAKNSN
jgi:predicted Zn-dependent protease